MLRKLIFGAQRRDTPTFALLLQLLSFLIVCVFLRLQLRKCGFQFSLRK